jgi:tetratricopeptide (TPR) repeat protein
MRNAATGLAYSLYGLRDYRAAEAAARDAIALWPQPRDRSAVSALNALGASLVAQRRFREAEPYLREAHDIYSKNTRPLRKAWYKPDVQSTLGAALAGLGRFEEAEPLLISATKDCAICRLRPPAISARRWSDSRRSMLRGIVRSRRWRGAIA